MRNQVGPTVKTVPIPQKSWASGETAALTETVRVNGRCTQIELEISAATDGSITFTLLVTSPRSGVLYTLAAIADAGTTVLKLQPATTDIGQWSANGDVVFTLTPDKDPGAAGVTVDVDLQFE